MRIFEKAHRNSILFFKFIHSYVQQKKTASDTKNRTKNCPESEKIYESKDKWKQIYDNVATAGENNTKKYHMCYWCFTQIYRHKACAFKFNTLIMIFNDFTAACISAFHSGISQMLGELGEILVPITDHHVSCTDSQISHTQRRTMKNNNNHDDDDDNDTLSRIARTRR